MLWFSGLLSLYLVTYSIILFCGSFWAVWFSCSIGCVEAARSGQSCGSTIHEVSNCTIFCPDLTYHLIWGPWMYWLEKWTWFSCSYFISVGEDLSLAQMISCVSVSSSEMNSEQIAQVQKTPPLPFRCYVLSSTLIYCVNVQTSEKWKLFQQT